jgi:hypothetical protein
MNHKLWNIKTLAWLIESEEVNYEYYIKSMDIK